MCVGCVGRTHILHRKVCKFVEQVVDTHMCGGGGVRRKDVRGVECSAWGVQTQTPRREEGALSISALSHPCKHMRRQNEDMHLKSASSSAIFRVVPLSHRSFGFSFFIFMAYSCLHLKTQVP